MDLICWVIEIAMCMLWFDFILGFFFINQLMLLLTHNVMHMYMTSKMQRHMNCVGAVKGLLAAPSRGWGGGGGGAWVGNPTKFYTGGLCPKAQTFTLLYIIFDRKYTPLVYI